MLMNINFVLNIFSFIVAMLSSKGNRGTFVFLLFATFMALAGNYKLYNDQSKINRYLI